MPVMSAVERAFCRSAPWGAFAGRVVLPWVLRDVQPSGTLLEIGGGTGVMAAQTLRRFPDLRLTMIDLDPRMVAAARRRLASTSSAVTAVDDVTELSFGDGTFDVVASYLMLHHVIAWQEAIMQVSRVLRPGGTFVGYDLLDTRAAALVHRLDRSPHRLISLEELRAGMASAGLEIVSAQRRFGLVVRFLARKPVAVG